MSDPVDLAQAREEEMRSDALAAFARQQQRARGKESAVECVRCAAPIPEARRLAKPGAQLCVVCQEDNEKWRR